MVGWCDGPGEASSAGASTIWVKAGQGPIALAVGADGGVFWTFFLSSILSSLSPSLWETARYRLKYCLKGPLNPKQPPNHYWLYSNKLTPTGLIMLNKISIKVSDQQKQGLYMLQQVSTIFFCFINL